jgi:hypothetical protein
MKDIRIQDAMNSETIVLQKLCPLGIVQNFVLIAMGRTVNFNDQLVANAKEISDKRRNWNLTSEFVTSYSAIPQIALQFSFRFSLRLAERSCALQSEG